MNKKQLAIALGTLLCILLSITTNTLSSFFVDVDLRDTTEIPTQLILNIINNYDSIRGINICLISVRHPVIKYWIKATNHWRPPNIFVINSNDDLSTLPHSARVTIISGSLYEALFTFNFARDQHKCNIIHYGEINSTEDWTAVWLASRMFVHQNNDIMWKRSSMIRDINLSASPNCDQETNFCAGKLQPMTTARSDLLTQLEYAKYIPRRGYGILFVAYNPDPEVLSESVTEAYTAAKIYRRHNPKSSGIQLGIITNDKNFDGRDLFDVVIGVKEELLFMNTRQWTTRVIYSSFSPFSVSMMIDSDTWNCGELLSFFQFMNDSQFDFAVNGHLPNVFDLPDCGVYAFKWTERTRLLLREWLNQFGEKISGDDQIRLLGAMQTLNGSVNIGLIRTTHSCRFSPGEGEGWGPLRLHQQTMILHGDVRIIHSDAVNEDICERLNTDRTRKRVFVCKSSFAFQTQFTAEEKREKLKQCLHPVFSQDECQEQLEHVCHRNDWDADPNLVYANPDFPSRDLE